MRNINVNEITRFCRCSSNIGGTVEVPLLEFISGASLWKGCLGEPIKPSRKVVRDSHGTEKRRIHLGNVSHPC